MGLPLVGVASSLLTSSSSRFTVALAGLGVLTMADAYISSNSISEIRSRTNSALSIAETNGTARLQVIDDGGNRYIALPTSGDPYIAYRVDGLLANSVLVWAINSSINKKAQP